MRFAKKEFPKVKEKTGDVIMGKVETELYIDGNNLNAEIMDQPLLFRKYAKLEAQAARAVRAIEYELDRAKARAHIEVSKTNEKLKVADKEAMVVLDPDVIEAQDQLIQAMEVHADMKGILTAFRQRHDSLKDLCANARRELVD